MNTTDDDKKLDYSNMKWFSIRWENEVFFKLLWIHIKTPDLLLRHIIHGTLYPKLKTNKYLSLTTTTLQVLAQASPRFCVDWKHTSDEAEWKKRCFNYKKFDATCGIVLSPRSKKCKINLKYLVGKKKERQ